VIAEHAFYPPRLSRRLGVTRISNCCSAVRQSLAIAALASSNEVSPAQTPAFSHFSTLSLPPRATGDYAPLDCGGSHENSMRTDPPSASPVTCVGRILPKSVPRARVLPGDVDEMLPAARIVEGGHDAGLYVSGQLVWRALFAVGPGALAAVFAWRN
jgi:hypothetical protein